MDSVSLPLEQMASLDPQRYLSLLRSGWWELSPRFRQNLLCGVVNHLRFRFGNVQSEPSWKPVCEPDGVQLAHDVLDELESRWSVWGRTADGLDGLNVCARVIGLDRDAERIAFLLPGTWGAWDSALEKNEKSARDEDLVVPALRSVRGIAAETATILARRLGEAKRELPTLLASSLRYFSRDPSESVRAMFVYALAAVQFYYPEVGWACYARVIESSSSRIWGRAERGLYYGYRRDFSRVAPYLDRMEADIQGPAGAAWGRISGLAVLAGHLPLAAVFTKLYSFGSDEAWKGVASVFAKNAHLAEHYDTCISGLNLILADAAGAGAAAAEFGAIFRAEPPVQIPGALLRRYFEALQRADKKGTSSYQFQLWLRREVMLAPSGALEACEMALFHGPERILTLFDDRDGFAVLTRLFREGEEMEGVDDGMFLGRVIAVQDELLRRGAFLEGDWLRDAERG